MPEAGTISSNYLRTKITTNPRYFNEFGRKLRAGEFSKMDRNSPEYIEMWREEYKKCILGCKIGDEYISGELYAYINFGNIKKIDKHGKTKEYGLPELRDVEKIMDQAMMESEAQGKSLMVISGRRKGKTARGTWRAVYTSYLLGDEACVGTGDDPKGKNAMDQVRAHQRGLFQTEFYTPVIRGTGEQDSPIILGWQEYDELKQDYEEVTTGGVIHYRNFRNNANAANGLSTKYFYMDEVGMFENLKESYKASEYCWKDGSTVFGFCLMTGTGGDMDRGSLDAAEMAYEPEEYNLLAVEDEEDPARKKTIMFLPGYYSYNDYRDEYGNVNAEAAKEVIKENRERSRRAKDLTQLNQDIQFEPLTLDEAFLKSGNNIFPTALISDQIKRIKSSPDLYNLPVKGEMFRESESGKVRFKPNAELQELGYPIKPADKGAGCIVIYEFPREEGGKVPDNMYIAGHDPYNYDSSATSSSVGSLFIYKRVYRPLVYGYDQVVAEYTGRPETLNEYNNMASLLLEYYNTIRGCLYENTIKGFKEYLEKYNMLRYLAFQPDLSNIVKRTTVNNQFGVHKTKEIDKYAEVLIRDWLLTEYAPGHYNVEKILSLPLLNELLDYDSDGNFDRVDAFKMVMLKHEDDYNRPVQSVVNENTIHPFMREHFEREGIA